MEELRTMGKYKSRRIKDLERRGRWHISCNYSTATKPARLDESGGSKWRSSSAVGTPCAVSPKDSAPMSSSRLICPVERCSRYCFIGTAHGGAHERHGAVQRG